MWEEREIGRRDLPRSVLVTAGQARGLPGHRSHRFPISQFPRCPGPGAALTCNGEGRAPARWRTGVTTRLVWERDNREMVCSILLCFNVGINILIMLCARCVLWMQPGLTLGPLPLWMMDEPGPSQDRVCSPAKASLPPPPLPSPLASTRHRYKLPSPYTFHWIKYSEGFLSRRIFVHP